MNVKTKFKEKSLSVLEKELDAVFSDFIRMRDSDSNGKVRCFICGVRTPWRQSQNGHYIPRASMATRYNEINCNAICEGCNCYDEYHEIRYEQEMIARYGVGAVVELERLRHSLQKFMRSDLVDLISDFKAKVESIRKEKQL